MCFSILWFTEIAGIYPITPSSRMATLIDEWSSKGQKNIFNERVSVVECKVKQEQVL